jgi:hypothetical protein
MAPVARVERDMSKLQLNSINDAVKGRIMLISTHAEQPAARREGLAAAAAAVGEGLHRCQKAKLHRVWHGIAHSAESALRVEVVVPRLLIVKPLRLLNDSNQGLSQS